jgi:nucleotide-binding universal stress UspA family protein
MKILFAADGSPCTKKALAFLVTNEGFAGPDAELLVLNVQPNVPNRVSHLVGSDVIQDFHREEAQKVLEPITAFLNRHTLKFRCEWRVGVAATVIVETAVREKSKLIVMGTHGYGPVSGLVMGSVAHRVVADCEVPVLLVK